MDRTETYQIRSTPFMRRMVSTSTKNGELQRLKQEYERIKNFNERTIEKQIKQARLRRLYHVIDIIKKSQPERQRARTKTQENLRAEQIKKARQMGMEFSRSNAVAMLQQPTHQTSFHSRSENLKFRFEPHNPKEEADRRTRSIRRLSFGNSASLQNRETISKGSSRRLTQSDANVQVNGTEEKRKNLLQRIKKGNEHSTNNLLQWQNMKNNKQEQQKQMEKSLWLDSINDTPATEWTPTATMPTATQHVYTDLMTEPEFSLERVEEQEHPCSTPVPSVIQETTQAPKSTGQDHTLELPSPHAASAFQQVRRLVMDAFKRPFSLTKTKSTSDTYLQESENLSEMETMQHQATSSIDYVQSDDEENQNELHQVNNSIDLQNLYEQIEIRDLGSRSSDIKCADSSMEDPITPDEIVQSCQNYMDNISEREEKNLRHSSTYDSKILHPFEKVIDLRSRFVDPISSHSMDKEELLKLRKVENLRAIFEN